MAEYFAGGHLRFVNGEWRDDNGDAIEISRVRHGQWDWNEKGEIDWEQFYRCSNCGDKEYWESKFCQDCGAAMDMEDSDGK